MLLLLLFVSFFVAAVAVSAAAAAAVVVIVVIIMKFVRLSLNENYEIILPELRCYCVDFLLLRSNILERSSRNDFNMVIMTKENKTPS